jgi:hypothetical protein
MSFFDDVNDSGLKLEKPVLGMPVIKESVFKATIKEFKPDEKTKAGKPAMILEFENAEAVVTDPEEGDEAQTIPAGKVLRSIYFNPYPYELKKEGREETKEEVIKRINEQLYRWFANIYGDDKESYKKFQAVLKKGPQALQEVLEAKTVYLGTRVSVNPQNGQRNNDFNPIKKTVYEAKKAAQAVS